MKIFQREIDRAVTSFLQTDIAVAEACSTDADIASGTTALAVLVMEGQVYSLCLVLSSFYRK